MKKLFLLYLCYCVCLCGNLSAQNSPVGQFKAHFPYHSFISVAASEHEIYAASNSSLLVFNKQNQQITDLSKVDKLSEVGIRQIAYGKETHSLIIVYTNSNIDILHDDGSLYNVNDLKNKQLSGSKAINHVAINKNKAYLSCDFGIVVLNMETHLITDTWFTGTSVVKELAFYQDDIYIITNDGIYYSSKDNRQIAQFSSWKKENTLSDRNFQMMTAFREFLFFVEKQENSPEDKIFVLSDGKWHEDSLLHRRYGVHSLTASENELLLCDWHDFWIYDTALQTIYNHNWVDYWTYNTSAEYAVLDGKDKVWVADYYLGLCSADRNTRLRKQYTLPGPHTHVSEAIDIRDGVVAVAPGSRLNLAASWVSASVSIKQNQSWKRIVSEFDVFPLHRGISALAINPKNTNEIYAGSWHNGLFKINNGEVSMLYDTTNSPLDGNDGVLLIGSIVFDSYNNLWVGNSQSSRLLKVLKADGSWDSFSLNQFVQGTRGVFVEQIMVDSRGYKWINVKRQGGLSGYLLVLDDNHTLSNHNDDKLVAVEMNRNVNVTTHQITCLTEDREGKIWIGTEHGIKLLSRPTAVFDGTSYAQNIYIEQGGYVQNLLEFEEITCITVDGANRKWIGTQKAGVFLISAAGDEEILHFTAENSPLFSNYIHQIAIDHQSGDVYIATSSGLLSYRGEATYANETYDEAKVFPNPVKSGYTGNISVSGLMDNSFCKITNAAGQLIFQAYAYGGQLVWNGRDFNGNRPATGIYFVFASDETGKKKKVCKFLFNH